MNKAAIKIMHGWFFLDMKFQLILANIKDSVISGLYEKNMFNFIQNDQIVLQSVYTTLHSFQQGIKVPVALTGVAQRGERLPREQKVPSSIPHQGTCLGCRFYSWLGCM